MEDKPNPLKIALNFLKTIDNLYHLMFDKKGAGENKRWSE